MKIRDDPWSNSCDFYSNKIDPHGRGNEELKKKMSEYDDDDLKQAAGNNRVQGASRLAVWIRVILSKHWYNSNPNRPVARFKILIS
jgi:hypothetical protein